MLKFENQIHVVSKLLFPLPYNFNDTAKNEKIFMRLNGFG